MAKEYAKTPLPLPMGFEQHVRAHFVVSTGPVEFPTQELMEDALEVKVSYNRQEMDLLWHGFVRNDFADFGRTVYADRDAAYNALCDLTDEKENVAMAVKYTGAGGEEMYMLGGWANLWEEAD